MAETKQTSLNRAKALEKNGIKKTKEKPMNNSHISHKTSNTAIGLRLHNNYEHILSEIQRNEEQSEAVQKRKAVMKSVT